MSFRSEEQEHTVRAVEPLGSVSSVRIDTGQVGLLADVMLPGCIPLHPAPTQGLELRACLISFKYLQGSLAEAEHTRSNGEA
jgi:hypothetical protein